MRIFVIHSGADRTTVKEKIDEIGKKTTGSEFLMLKNGGKLWKLDAKNMIKKAQLVLVFVGKNSSKSPNIAWEINAAQKANKEIITILLNESNELPPALFRDNTFTREKQITGETKNIDEVINVINTYSNGDYALFNTDADNLDYNALIEQYKVFLQTSETLVERRQGVNNFYISVNSALVAAFSIISAIGQDMLAKCFIGIVFSCIGIILCLSWIRILNSYGLLNASKMKIISLIEKRLPASLYDAEWRAQSDKLNSRPYVSFTECETRIPKIFICVYIVIAVLVTILFLHGTF
ncbi:MAG: TIR domain-containing protein [Huintestinicola sp.]